MLSHRVRNNAQLCLCYRRYGQAEGWPVYVVLSKMVMSTQVGPTGAI